MDPMDPMDEDSPAEDHGPPERRLTDASSNSATTTRAPASSAHATSSASAASSKRRRGLGVVTPNACTECRKKRAKVTEALCPSLVCFVWEIGPPHRGLGAARRNR